MSRRARLWHVAREAKTAQAFSGPDDDTDDEGGIDAEPCPQCDDGDGHCAFPYYGAAPHRCYDTLGLQIGQSQELPEAEWPANFRLDPESGPFTGYPRAGTYTHCLHCGAGATP